MITVTETWLDSSIQNAEIELPGYISYRLDRNRNRGGVYLSIRDDLLFKPHPELQREALETALVELLLPETKPIVVSVCYRP